MQQPEIRESRQSGLLMAFLKDPGFWMPVIVLILIFWLQVPVSAEYRYAISERDTLVNLNTDGSADITERIDFTLNGSVNNLVMEIAKPEKSEIILKQVAMAGLNKLIVCRPLERGEWNNTVFSETYSVVDEPDRLRVKVYYPYGTIRSTFYLQYRILQAVNRYLDVADFVYKPVLKEWPTKVDNIKVRIILPVESGKGFTNAFFRGVLVGNVKKTGKQMMDFNIPNTVPGEELAFRVMFPSDQVPDAPWWRSAKRWEDLRAEELKLEQEAVQASIRTREETVVADEKQAFEIAMQNRISRWAVMFSLLFTAAGLFLALLASLRIRHPNTSASKMTHVRIKVIAAMREHALNTGMIFFALGLIFGVSMAIWQAYLMMLPGFLLILLGNKHRNTVGPAMPEPV